MGIGIDDEVQGFRTGTDDGNKSEGKTSRKDVTSLRVKESARCPFCLLKYDVNLRQKFMRTVLSYSR